MGKISEVAGYIRNSRIGASVAFEHVFPGKGADVCGLDIIESQIVRDAVFDSGIESLFTHQAEAYTEIRKGRDVLITTPTSSGKTLCYNLPIIEDMYHNREVTALYLFPLKALGRDQLRSLESFLSHIPLGDGIGLAVVDGDTDKKHRRKIQKDRPNIIFSNPDILHYAMLPKKGEWSDFLNNLKYIVVDELHTYRGIFGNHVYNLFARFMRLYPNVQIISCSATIGNPKEFADTMFSRDFYHVSKSGAPTGEKRFMLLNSELPMVSTANYLLKVNLEAGLKTICFTKSRKQTERIFANLLAADAGYARTVSSYRAGFLPEERREIENELASGKLQAVISTSAFELGIDIGGVDCTILAGYPGSLMSLWQRAGRSGRRGDDSLVIMIAGFDALDQYYVKHPAKLYDSAFENVVIDTQNETVNTAHIKCAAYEKPIEESEPYCEMNTALIEKMLAEGAVFRDASNGRIFSLKYPYGEVDLRMAGDSYSLYCGNTLIATASGRRAYMDNFNGAVYMHRGNSFIITSVDRAKKEIKADPFNGNYFTVANTDKNTMVEAYIRQKQESGMASCFCGLKVTELLTGYSRISGRTGEKITDVPLEETPIQFSTKGMYVLIPDSVRDGITAAEKDFMGSIHAFEHAMISVIPTFYLAARDDIGGISYPYHPQLGSSAVFMYDAYPGGIGINERVYERFTELVERTLELVKGCECEAGCPACIYSPKCGSGNYPLDKAGAVMLMEMLLSGEHLPKDAPAQETKMRTDTLVYDIETKHSADDVGGWRNSHKMGISAAVVYSFEKDGYEVYTEKDADLFISRLEGAKCIIGFNNVGFDNKVITGYRIPDFSKTMVFDILADVLSKTGRRFSLDNMAGATIGASKTADGLQALEWYKNGEMDKIIEYCKADVEVTKNLFLHGAERGFVNALLKEGAVIRIPVEWGSLVLF